MKRFPLLFFIFSTLQTAAYAQRGEGTFLGQCSATSLATGGHMIDYSMVDSSGVTLHVQRPYSIKALDRMAVEAVLPIQTLRIRAVYTQAGDENLLEQSILTFFGKRVTKAVHVNVGCGVYFAKSITGSSSSNVYADLGVLYNLNTHVSAGFRLVNPTGSKQLEQYGIIGVALHPSRTFFMLVESDKRPQKSPVTRFGLNYMLNHAFIVQGGLSFYPVQPAFGISGQTGRVRYNVGVRSHPQLGLTTAFSCSYVFRRKP